MILIILILAGYQWLIAAYLTDVSVQVTQPNGNVINCFASGDEYYHWLHDKDGFTITRNPVTGYWVYAERKGLELNATGYIVGKDDPRQSGLEKWLKPDWSILKNKYESKQTRLNKQRLLKTSGSVLSKGTLNNLVIFVRFSDQEGFPNPLSYYQEQFDGTNDTSRSFKNYYASVSYNQLTINSSLYPESTSEVVLSYRDIHKRDYYRSNTVAPDSGYENTEEGYARLSQMGKRAIEHIASQVPADLNIDANNDGNVDNVVFLCAGNVEGWDDVLWPLQGTVDFETFINGKKVGVYNQQFDEALSVSVLCHEMFHTLGGPDLYHYKPEYKKFQPAGNWDLMQNDQNENMVAYMKYRYGKWINVIPEITASGTYTLNPLGGKDTTNICYKIKSPNSEKEYFMVEFRDKKLTFDTDVPSTGVIFYRINTERDGLGNTDGPPDEVYIYRPNGTAIDTGDIDLAGFCPDSNRTAFNDNTNPSCFLSDGNSGGINVSNIKLNGETASFEISFEPSAVENENKIPSVFSLSQNYPNPFNPSTLISYQLPENAFVTLKVYDMLGREVATLVNEFQHAGSYSTQLSVSNSQLSTGIYFYSIKAGKFSQTKKMLLMK